MSSLYFDYAATTPMDPLVIQAMNPYFFEKFGNASSPHSIGREAQKAVEDVRKTLAQFIGAQPNEIIFTSGATEANNHALLGAAKALRHKGNHVIVSAVEHHSVLEPAEELEKNGFKVTFAPVDPEGRVNPELIKGIASASGQTILLAVMHASNEVGTIQPIVELGAFARENDIAFMVDAVQTVGHVSVNVDVLGVDYLTLSAHKFYGPKGVGALYVRKGRDIDNFILGGDQERGRRASTQNVAGIVGLGKAIELCRDQMAGEISEQTRLRDRLLHDIPKGIEGVHVNGSVMDRLPNNAHFSFEGLQGEALLMSLDMNGICASMGSACTSGAMEPSHVLRAMNISDELAYGSLRLTIGRWTTEEHIDTLLNHLPNLVSQLRS